MNLLFILNKPPYSSDIGKESLDMALAHATFDDTVSLLFTGQGVWQLKTDQFAKLAGLKEFTRLYTGLDLYDIDQLFVSENALDTEQLTRDQLMIEAAVLNDEAISRLINRQDRVFCL